MERDILEFSKQIMNGDDEVCGHLTTGGTDSIANGILAHKFWSKEVKGITKPNIVISKSTHLAFIRACKNYEIECRIVDYTKDFVVDFKAFEK